VKFIFMASLNEWTWVKCLLRMRTCYNNILYNKTMEFLILICRHGYTWIAYNCFEHSHYGIFLKLIVLKNGSFILIHVCHWTSTVWKLDIGEFLKWSHLTLQLWLSLCYFLWWPVKQHFISYIVTDVHGCQMRLHGILQF